ncbi:MAG: hypothetical protein JXR07_20140 [Reichenbachiella sp.]
MIKVKHGRFEMFPAIIMPSGHYKVNVDDSVVFITRELYGMSKIEGVGLAQIDPLKFMNGIPIQYLGPMSRNQFGLKPKDRQLQILKTKYLERTKVNQSDLNESKEWIKDRLIAQKCKDTILVFRIYENHISLSNREGIKKKLLDEEVYKLY